MPDDQLSSKGPRGSFSLEVTQPEVDPELATAVRKVGRRLGWFLFALYLVSVIDRGNLAFASLFMNEDLGIDVQTFGVGVGIFFLGYSLLEIPSNLALARFGARITLTRIALLWGFATIAMAFVVGPRTFLAMRFLLGAAEAGLTPGVVLFLSFWIPAAYRARYNAMFFYAAPVAYILGAVASGYLLRLDGSLGLKGWQWLFIVEGVPAIVLGGIGMFYLVNKPSEARWLSEADRIALLGALANDARPTDGSAKVGVLAVISDRFVLLCCIAYLGVLVGNVTVQAWLPQIVRSYGFAVPAVGWICAVPPLVGMSIAFFIGRHSDLKRERIKHTTGLLVLAALGYAIVAAGSGLTSTLIGFTLANIGIYAATAIFWTIPQTILRSDAAPAAIAIISSFAALGGWLAPIAIGYVQKSFGSLNVGFVVGVLIFLAAAGAMLLLGRTTASRYIGC